MIDSDSWRLWPHGDRKQMKDKQVYREIAKATADDLARVKTNFEWIADNLEEILTGHKVNARAVIFMGSAADSEYGQKIAAEIGKFGVPTVLQISSAHKSTRSTLDLADEFEGVKNRSIDFFNEVLGEKYQSIRGKTVEFLGIYWMYFGSID